MPGPAIHPGEILSDELNELGVTPTELSRQINVPPNRVTQIIHRRRGVTVVPVTHTPPTNPDDAVEIPAALKAHLGLDDLPSWIVVTETNDFLWAGPDLWPIPGTKPNRFDYGMLPTRFFAHVRDRILQAHLRRRLDRVQRSE
jgi:hypothetical protein